MPLVREKGAGDLGASVLQSVNAHRAPNHFSTIEHYFQANSQIYLRRCGNANAVVHRRTESLQAAA
jgi:hypothetical protein